jgi:hypothetical protein
MPRKHSSKIDFEKISTPKIVTFNLMLASLYLTAFELIRASIIQGVKEFLVINSPPPKDLLKECNPNTKEFYQHMVDGYKNELDSFRREVGIDFNADESHLYKPCCEWLAKREAIDSNDLINLLSIRDHRNEIAHEIHYLLMEERFDINVDLFIKIRTLLRKIDIFWARNDLLVNPDTLEEADIHDISDDQLISFRVGLMDILINSVVTTIEQQNK